MVLDRLIDLHTHSKYSDGSMAPAELVRHAKESGLAAISLTDHDGIDGVAEALAEGTRIGLEVVPGVELSAKSDTETHILGYFIDINAPVLVDTIKRVQEMRVMRNFDTCSRLQENGFDITIEDAQKFAGTGMLARAHFAKAMVEKGYVGSVKEAFDKYLSTGKPCYSSMQLLTAAECIKLINTAGGLAFLAHLHLTKMPDDELVSFLKELKNAGLAGVEGYYTEYTPKMQDKYQKTAKDLGLLICGGTDFHGAMKPHIAIGKGLGNMEIPYSILEDIKKNIK